MPVGLHIEWGIVKAAVAFLFTFAAIMLYYSLRGRQGDDSMKKITLAMLKERQACQSQVRKFKKLYPNGFSVTKANVIAADKAGLDVPWAAWELMQDKKAEKHFNKIEDPAWREWVRTNESTMSKKARDITDAAYREALAKAFVEGWKMQCATKEKP